MKYNRYDFFQPKSDSGVVLGRYGTGDTTAVRFCENDGPGRGLLYLYRGARTVSPSYP
jgi:hypothetical protein